MPRPFSNRRHRRSYRSHSVGNRYIRRVRGPGKFECEDALTLYAYDIALAGFADESEGDGTWGECFDLIRGPWSRAEARNVDSEGLKGAFGLPSLNRAERRFLVRQAGCILYTCSQGFVTCTWYRSEKHLDKAWYKVTEMFEDVQEVFEDE